MCVCVEKEIVSALCANAALVPIGVRGPID